MREDSRAFADLAALLRAPAGEAAARLEALLEDKTKLERELADAKRKLAMGGGGSGAAEAVRDVAGVKFYARVVAGVDMKDLKSLADEAKPTIGSGVVAHRRDRRGRQGEPRRRGHGGLDGPLQRGRSGQAGFRSVGRQGWRRPSRHGAGRRARRGQGRGRARGGGGGNPGQDGGVTEGHGCAAKYSKS